MFGVLLPAGLDAVASAAAAAELDPGHATETQKAVYKIITKNGLSSSNYVYVASKLRAFRLTDLASFVAFDTALVEDNKETGKCMVGELIGSLMGLDFKDCNDPKPFGEATNITTTNTATTSTTTTTTTSSGV